MSLKKFVHQIILLVLLFALMPVHASSAATDAVSSQYLFDLEKSFGVHHPSMRVTDHALFRDHYAAGGDLFGQFVRFLFPISGREKRVGFLPAPFWGIKKPRYKLFEWERFESDHFDFYTYPEGQLTLQLVIKYFEEEYERNNRIFGTQNRFEKKIPIIYYQSRRDFEQTSIVDGPIPEGLGGLTEIFGWKRVTFPFEGEQSKFEHVTKHEATHIFQIEKNARRLPLWFIEGSAETNSIYWDADADMIIRDAYVNGFFYPISQLWQIQGTWLMYKIGNYITNLIWDQYGEEGFNKIFENANQMNFESNIKKSLGITVAELDQMVQAKLLVDYGPLLAQSDALDASVLLHSTQVVMDSHEHFYVTGGAEGARNALFLHYKDQDHQTRKTLIKDKQFENESLESFRKGVDIADGMVVYSIKQSRRDELRIQHFDFDEQEKKITLGKLDAVKWNHIDKIEHPVWVKKNIVYFIGYEVGFSNLYKANIKTKKLTKLTDDQSHYDQLDYCPAKKKFVLTKEGERSEKYIAYERHIFLMDAKARMQKITSAKEKVHMDPSFSSDCSMILYTSDVPSTYNIFTYNLEHQTTEQLTNARVGFRKPFWGPENTILFNGYEKLSPSVYQTLIPDTKEIVSRSIRGSKKFAIQVPVIPKKEHEVKLNTYQDNALPVMDGIYVYQQSGLIRNRAKPYVANAVATFPDRMVIRSEEGVPGQDRIKENSFSFFFEAQGQQVTSLQSNMVAAKGASEETLSWIATKLQGQGIIQSWTSNTDNRVLVSVNNRLANDYEAFKNHPEISLLVYNEDKNLLNPLPDGPIQSLDDNIQWVSFLQNEYILFVLSEKRTGPYRLIIYDSQEKEYYELSQDASMFRVSEDQSKMIWKSAHYMFLNLLEQDPVAKKIKIEEGKIQALALLHDGHIGFVAVEGSNMVWIKISPETMEAVETKKYEFEDRDILNVLIHPTGAVVTHTKGIEDSLDHQLSVWDIGKDQVKLVRQHQSTFTRVIPRGRYVTFLEQYRFAKPGQEFVFSIDEPETVLPLYDLNKVEQLERGDVVWESDRELVLFDKRVQRSRVIGYDTLGFDVRGNNVIYSELLGRHFAIKSYDSKQGTSSLLFQDQAHLISPVVQGTEVQYLKKSSTQIQVQGPVLEKRTLESIDVIGLEKDTQGQVIAYAQRKPHATDDRPVHEASTTYPRMYLSRPAKKSLKLQSLAAAAAYDGDNVRLLVSGFADNLFGDKGVFANSILLSDTKFTTIGFTDLARGYSTSGFFNEREGIQSFGANFTKDFILDRYRQVSAYTDFEIQSYDDDSSDLNDFLTPDFDGERFFLLKLGGIYALDITVRDLHGPISGQRLYFRTEAGLNVEDQTLSNYDFNMDVRIYNHILPRFGLAHRLIGGTSQGDVPNIYLVGGNISFRGAGFDDLIGQNYWVFSEDLRLPMFDFAGAKFFDPVDQILGFLTRFFDVRVGLYTDIGSVWNNGEDADLVYSVGYFINIPTVFGLIIRLHDGVFGEDNFGFWLGTNW